MPSRPSVIDADGHILDRQSDIHGYLEPPWNRRPVNLWPSEPWDTELFGTRDRGEEYNRKMTPGQQVDTWLKVMDREGMETAVCFPTGSGKVSSLQETPFAVVAARACNNHFAKDFNSHSKRVKVVGVLPLQDPAEAVKELRRAYSELGLVSFEIRSLGLPLPFGDPTYEPLFAEAERLGCPLAIHGSRTGAYQIGAGGFKTFNEVHTYAFPVGILLHFTSLVFNAIPLKFPKLRLGFLEIGATWLPYWLDRMDEHWEMRGRYEAPGLTKKPSDVVRESHMYFTVEPGESLVPETVNYLGDRHFMYASDFPHWDSEFPESLDQLWNHPKLSESVKRRILYDNAKEFFGLGC
jgi:predicted TIM-barrel fold metal-dependent hydrolase